MVSLKSLNLVTKILYLNLEHLVKETRMLLHNQQDEGNRQDLCANPNSCFSDSSDSLNLLHILNFLYI